MDYQNNDYDITSIYNNLVIGDIIWAKRYANEKEIKSFVKRNNIKVMDKACPMDGHSKREEIKKYIYNLSKEIPHVRANVYGAIKRSNISGWKI